MNRKIIISAGHGGNDPGAVANGYTERDLAIENRRYTVNNNSYWEDRISPYLTDYKKRTYIWRL